MKERKVASYIRVSSQEQAEGKCSIPTQQLDIEKQCQRQDDTIVLTYTDIQSGRDAHKDREQFEQMLKDARRGLFDKIVVWRPDRLFRGLTPAAKLAKVLDETGIQIEAVLQPLDRRMIGLWAWVAEQEIEAMKDRFSAGKRGSAREGKWGGGFTKYGYRYNSDKRSANYTGKLEIDEAEASVVRSLSQWVSEGKKASSWCKWANEQGIPTKRRSQGWTPQEVSEILRDRCYTGRGAYGKLTRRGNRLVPADNPVSLSYPRIIDDDLFESVQQRLLENKQGNRGSTRIGRTYILQHIGRCGVCGGRLCCTTNGMGYRYIYCLNQRRFPHIYHCYKPQNWKLSLVEDYIWAEVEDILHNYRNSTYDLLLDKFESAKGEREQQIVRAKGQLDELKLEKQRLLTTIRKGYVTEVEAEVQFIAINSERKYWEQELTNLQALQDNDNTAPDAFMVQLKQLDRWFDYGFNPSPEQKKQLLVTLLKEFVLCRDGKIELRFKLPVNEKQVADSVLTLSRNNTTFGNFYYESIRTLRRLRYMGNTHGMVSNDTNLP